MNLLPLLLGEHGPLRHLVKTLELAAPRMNEAELHAATLAVADAVESHAHLEDELLFDTLVASGRLPQGPVEAMLAEHREIEKLFGQLLAPAGEPGRPDPQRTVLRLAESVRHHFDHEENVLFPLAAGALGDERLESLGRAWAERRKVDVAPLARALEVRVRGQAPA